MKSKLWRQAKLITNRVSTCQAWNFGGQEGTWYRLIIYIIRFYMDFMISLALSVPLFLHYICLLAQEVTQLQTDQTITVSVNTNLYSHFFTNTNTSNSNTVTEL